MDGLLSAKNQDSSACSKCGGSGWIILERDGISGAERCECAKTARPQRVEEQSGIPPLYQNVDLDSFNTSGFMPDEEKVVRKLLWDLKTYVREYPPSDRPGLLFTGAPGTGKTYLAVAVFRAAIRKMAGGVFFDYQTLLDQIRSGYDKQSGATDKEAYRTALESELLLLDDLGAHRVTDFTQDVVTALLTHRCNNRMPTILTTNWPLEGSSEKDTAKTLGEVIGWRAVSRLHEMCRIIKMPINTDYRMRKR